MKNIEIIVMLNIITLFLFLISCASSTDKSDSQQKNSINIANCDEAKKKSQEIVRMNDTVVYNLFDSIFEVVTMIKYPPKDVRIKASILMLHGWNLPANEWCEKTDFCKKALNDGYVLIIPNYSKSNYVLEIYPETISEYRKFPTLTWIINYHIPDIQKKINLLREGQDNFVAGISTGGRGAVMLAYYMPNVFASAATLSGDFDITKMTDEYLYYSFLGHYRDFPDRWDKEHFASDCKNYKTHTYIGHGQQDNIAPVEQSFAMYDSIKKYNSELKIIGNFPLDAKHDYIYWKSETDNILNFFNSCLD